MAPIVKTYTCSPCCPGDIETTCCPSNTIPATLYAHFNNVGANCNDFVGGLVIKLLYYNTTNSWVGQAPPIGVNIDFGGLVVVQLVCDSFPNPPDHWRMTVSSDCCGGNYATPVTTNCAIPSFEVDGWDGNTAWAVGGPPYPIGCPGCAVCNATFDVVINTNSTGSTYVDMPFTGYNETDAVVCCKPGIISRMLYWHNITNVNGYDRDTGTLSYSPGAGTWGNVETITQPDTLNILIMTLACNSDLRQPNPMPNCGCGGMDLYLNTDFAIGGHLADTPCDWTSPWTLTFVTDFDTFLISDQPI